MNWRKNTSHCEDMLDEFLAVIVGETRQTPESADEQARLQDEAAESVRSAIRQLQDAKEKIRVSTTKARSVMSFNEDEIQQLAEIRGQEAVLCRVDGRDCWLMADPSDTSLTKLAESLNTDTWTKWLKGLISVYDKNGDLLYDTDASRKWSELSPLEFREMRWCVVEVTGMSRGTVIFEATTRYKASKKRFGFRSVQIRFLPKGSKGKEVSL